MMVLGTPMAERDQAMFGRLAHDLRGPLAPLQTAAYLLRQGDFEAERVGELLDIIDRQASRLNAMVRELADWHCVEQGRMRAREDVTELAMLLGNACDGLRTPDAINLELDLELEEASVVGDPQRLTQMFSILFAFAVSRSDEGGVRVTGSRVDDVAILTIRYRPANNEADRGQDGDLFNRPQAAPFDGGLGWRLMIANAIAQAHGGMLMVEAGDSATRAVGVHGICVRLPVQAAG